MLDRTTFDLRIAEHHTTTAQINRQGWQQHGHTDHCHGHAASASVLVALAARLVAFGRTGGGAASLRHPTGLTPSMARGLRASVTERSFLLAAVIRTRRSN